MLKLSAILSAVVVLQIAQGQDPPPPPPPQCRGPPAGVEKPHECCKIPPFFKEEDLKECGFEKLGEGEPPKGPPQKPRGPPDCSKQLCMLEKNGLTADSETVNKEAVIAFMTDYAEKNPEFAPAMDVAKERCLGKEIPGPPHICEANRLVFCVTHTLFSECPKWEESDNCAALKKHMEECKPFFPH